MKSRVYREPRNGKPKLHRAAGALLLAEVADGVAGPRVEQRHRSGDAALADGGVGVAQREIVDVGAELPLQPPPLAPAEEVRLLEPEESADPRALPQRRAEVDVAGAALLDPEYDVHVDAVGRRLDVRRGERLLEEAEVGDVLVRTDQALAAEEITGEHDDRLADDPLVRHVVADDLDLVDRGRRALPDGPAKVDDVPAVGRGAPDLGRLHLGVQVAVVGVEVLDLLRGRFPVGAAVRPRAADRGSVGADWAEGVVRLQLLAREPAVALDVEGADLVLLALVHTEMQHGLAAGASRHQRVVRHLEVDEARCRRTSAGAARARPGRPCARRTRRSGTTRSLRAGWPCA